MEPRRPSLGPVLAVFALSGAAGLIYEVVWSRQLVLVFGNTTQAVSTILTGYFAGMALGSLLGGRLADRVRSPLRLYGVLELVLVGIVVATPHTFPWIGDAYRGAYPSLQNHEVGLALIRFALAVLALSPATVLMGATLPALTRQLGDGEHLSKAFGRLYTANTYGAVIGTLLSGLVLIEWVGLTHTLYVGAVGSAVGGLTALLLSRSRPPRPPAARVAASHSGRPRLGYALAFVSGLTSLGYQVLWTRLLSSGTGNITYVFTLILAVFLIGIALGAQVFNVLRERVAGSVAVLAGAQAAIAALATAGLVFVIAHPLVLSPNDQPLAPEAVFRTVLIVVLPTTVVLGFMLPASATLLADSAEAVGTRAGRLLAANTTGAIVGTFVLPFAIIPLIGAAHTVLAVAAVNIAMALRLAGRPSAAAVPAGLAAAGLVAATVVPGAVRDPGAARILAEGGTITKSAEDRIAAVQAGTLRGQRRLWVTGTSMTLLTVDAKLMPILPLMMRPQSQRALTVAFGMGSAYRASLIAGMQTTAAELVPSVPKMYDQFYPDARQVLANPRGHVVITDGRNFLELTRQHFDIIVTDPPPPIESSGASVISSLEYYEAGHRRLTTGGIMMQWLPFGSTLEEAKAHLRTFRHVYRHMMVLFGPGGFGMYMLGSDQPLALDDTQIAATLDRPGVLADLSSAYDSTETTVPGWTALLHRQLWLSDDAVDAFVGSGPLVTDDRPYAEYYLLRRMTSSSPFINEAKLRAASR